MDRTRSKEEGSLGEMSSVASDVPIDHSDTEVAPKMSEGEETPKHTLSKQSEGAAEAKRNSDDLRSVTPRSSEDRNDDDGDGDGDGNGDGDGDREDATREARTQCTTATHPPLTRHPGYNSAAIVGMQYDIIKTLTPGSEGDVYVCIRHGDETGTKVVVKTGSKGTTEKEVMILRMLNHPSVIKVLHAFRSKATVCMTTPLYRCDLYTYLDRYEIPMKKALKIQWCLLSALAYLHDRGIIHRDVKPENIFLDCPENACLGDFGAACRIVDAPNVPRDYGWSGTLETNAPELLARDPYCANIDVWSAGLVLYELVFPRTSLFGYKVPNGPTSQLKNIIKTLQVHPMEFPRDKSTKLCRIYERYAMMTRSPFTVPYIIRQHKLSLDMEYALCKMIAFDPERRPNARDVLTYDIFHEM
ncbi:serine/threonine protein kinase US3 [Falconid herpesvirus 1]|uniref:Serine/threonine protein kinase US3 n=1 Tax=Falconid herpesvirus 1 TaxID=1510155 RepID=A0A068ER91_9ALPH|nr:serine/threonine protein kinase US3 [Falconid herpesvirus 1]AID52797.1 serine/threonine protein kinase US3 [Falconid herpesvirus 1]